MIGFEYSEVPYHSHDCEACAFLGSVEMAPGKWIDYYTCPNGPGRTYIARFGSEGPDYTSMNAMMLSDLDMIPADPLLAMLWLLWSRDDAAMRLGR